MFSTNRICFKIVRRQTKMRYQQQVSYSGSHVMEHIIGKSRQSPPLVLGLDENILSTCSNKNDVV